MKIAKTLARPIVLTLALAVFLSVGAVRAQESTGEAEPPTDEANVAIDEEELHYSDYKVKAYSLTGFYGDFSGTTYLENMELGPRTVYEEGANYIIGYDGNVLQVSRDDVHYDAAHKKIESGPAFGARIGIHVNKDFHMDLIGTYATGRAVTTMLYKPDPDDSSLNQRIEVDSDDGFSLVKGGVHLGYDAHPITFWGITPRLGFGLGGLINRYTVLEDKTALYLEGNFGLKVGIVSNLSLAAQADLTTFAYKVDELGYSNIVKYYTYTLGLTWFFDVIPEDVRAAHVAELEALER
jgi:hypothetical protein